jgi:hypothetical protein
VNERRLAAAIVALAAVGFCRQAYFHFWVEPHVERPIPGPPIEDEFLSLRAALPPSGEVGYVTDEPILKEPGREFQAAKQRFLQIQYSLVPLVVRYDDDRAPLVIASVLDEKNLPSVLQSRGLTVVTQVAPRIAIARPH